jgi:serine/threonine-protein kinase
MGFVYRGFDPVIHRTVAIKTIARDLLDDGGEQVVARFQNEARAAGRLSHPSIVGVYEYGEDDDVAFIAMEYVEGFALKDFLRQRGKMSASDAVGVMLPLLDGLEYAHEQGVVHRDIKPANLIITSKGKIKITDFGIARIESSTLTQVGTIIGTPSYMSPEQFMGGAADQRSDIYSAGVVLFELLSGKRPFEGAVEALAYRICKEPPPRISEADPDVSPFFDPVIDRALAKRPEDRFQSAVHFAEAVRVAFQAAFNVADAPALSEETVVLTVRMMRADAAARPSGEGTRQATAGGASQSASTSQWQEKTLNIVERQLASFIGPLAKIMVKRAAHNTTSIHELYEALASKLDTEPERRAFLARKAELGVEAGPQTAPSATSPGTSFGVGAAVAQIPVSQALIDKAIAALVRSQGPIARVLAQRAAKTAPNPAAFVDALAAALSDPADRTAFLRDLGPLDN